jgi:hypothetical protein
MTVVTLDAYTGVGRLRLAAGGDVIRSEVKRDEGGVMMSLIDPVLSVECDGVDFTAIHPDILALIGVLAFYPALPQDEFVLRLGFPVSPKVEAALRRAWILPGVRVVGTGVAGEYEPKRETVLSYGGGLDSLAASIIFPDVPLVHETPLPTRKAMFTDVVNGMVEKSGPGNFTVFDNLRQLFTAWGLPLWVSVYVASLILEPRRILSGSEMTGTYLLGGRKYFPRYGNLWYKVFEIIGVSVHPTSFLSEIGNARVVAAHERMEDAAYCAKIDRTDCNTCTKCLRRRMIRGMFNPEELKLVDDFVVSDSIVRFLDTRPMYYGDVFIHAAASQDRPTWVNEHLSDLLDTHGKLSFHDSYYADSFEHFRFPADLRAQAEAAMAVVGIEPFGEAEEHAFRTYEQLPSTAETQV